jgi:hypothetical protein
VQSNALRSNAMPTIKHTLHGDAPTTERMADDQTHATLRLIAPPAIERNPDLEAHFILLINRTSLYSFDFYVLGGALRARNPLFLTV